MFNRLPDYANPYALCDKDSVFSGQMPIAAFPRLSALLDDLQGDVEYHLTFAKDNAGRFYIANSVKACLTLQCQRCLQRFDYPVAINTQVSLVNGIQEAQQLPEQYEPLLLTESQLKVVDLIEDELILAVPDVPKHAEADCAVNLLALNRDLISDAESDDIESSENPFAVLADLKHKIT